jgi:hypothetical protein
MISAAETDRPLDKTWKCREFSKSTETRHRDRTGWLTTQSLANLSLPKIP